MSTRAAVIQKRVARAPKSSSLLMVSQTSPLSPESLNLPFDRILGTTLDPGARPTLQVLQHSPSTYLHLAPVPLGMTLSNSQRPPLSPTSVCPPHHDAARTQVWANTDVLFLRSLQRIRPHLELVWKPHSRNRTTTTTALT